MGGRLLHSAGQAALRTGQPGPEAGECSLAALTRHPGDQFSVSDTSKLILLDRGTTSSNKESSGHCSLPALFLQAPALLVVSVACPLSCTWLPLSSDNSFPAFPIQTP